MRGLSALLRLARRDARRDRWRTVLVVALVALPVAGLGATIALGDTLAPTAEERVRDQLGRADAAALPVQLPAGVDPLADLAASLPDGTVLEPRRGGSDALVKDGVRHELTLSDQPQGDDALGRRYRLLQGRAPTTDSEIALAETLAEDLGLAIGDEVSLEARGPSTVVGIVRRPENLHDRTVLVAPGTLAETRSLDVLIDLPPGSGPETLAPLSAEAADGQTVWHVTERAQQLGVRLSGGQRWVAIIIGGLAAVEVALIAGAAFAVSVRRRQRELGLLAAVGGTRRDVRRVVLLTGVTVGVVGAAIGTVLAILALVAASPWLEPMAGREISGLRLDPWWFAAVAALGIGSATIGAWWPARSVAALPVTVALSGRRPSPQPSGRTLRAGVVVMVAGALVTGAGAVLVTNPFVFLLGSVLLVLGAGLTSPWLLEQVGRVAPRLPAGPRLALRDAARFRTRNGPIVTAAMAGLAASISVATVVGSMDASESASYQPSLATDQVLVYGDPSVGRAVATATGGDHAVVRYAGLEARWSDPDRADGDGLLSATAVVGTPELARALGGDRAARALAAGQVVLFGSTADEVELVAWDEAQVGARPVERSVGEAEVLALPTPGDVPAEDAAFPTVLVPDEVVQDRDPGSATLVTLPEPIDDATFELAREAAASASASSGLPGGEAFVVAERGYRSSYAMTLLVVLAVGAIAGLLVVSVAIALAAAEARSDLRTLTAVGASSRTRRSLAAGRATLLAGIGGLLAVPVGLVPGAAIVGQVNDASFTVPWTAIATATLVVPLVATAGAMIASSRSPTPSVRGTA